MSERDIFTAAREMTDPAARCAYLDGACGGDPGLRSRVEALLRAHEQPNSLLDHPAVAARDPDPGATEALNGAPDPGAPAPRTAAGENGSSDDEALAFLAPPNRPDSLGRIGHYEVLQVLGRGGFGIVFRAFDETLQRVVALKVMAPPLAATSPARKRFLREARSSAQVRHENVVQVYEVAEQPLPYLAMEFIPGETLQQRLDRIGPVEPAEVVRIGRQIAEGLAAAHATDLIHRDIKPGNVLLEGGQQKVKITDFGLARAADDASISQSGIIAGTPMYMAPEQAEGQTLDQRADLFSLGSVLYQMVTGRPPFRAGTTVAVLKRVAEDQPRAIREIIPETPQWLCDIIAKLHAKNPDERYQSAREVADVLADCEAQLKAHARLKDYSRIPRNKPQRSGRWQWAALAAAVLLPVIALVVTEFAGVTHLFRGQQPAREPINPSGEPTLPMADGWAPLFNGKDLTGWKTHKDQPGDWKVEDGVLVGRPPQEPSHLFTERGDFEDFHFRVAAMINAKGDSGQLFRCEYGLGNTLSGPNGPRSPMGYEANIGFLNEYKTGSLWGGAAWPPVGPRESLIEPDKWFTQEVIAQGNHIIIKVNGTTTVDTVDSRFRRGHLALQAWANGTVVRFRKIEIKELPPAGVRTESGAKDKPSPTAIAPFTDADVQRIAALPPEQQVEEVRKELRRRNPGFDGKMDCKTEGGAVTEFRIVTDQVTDIAPIRVFNDLRVLECSGTYTDKPNGLLADLTPLKGMNLAGLLDLNLVNTKVNDAGMVCFKNSKNLTALTFGNTPVSDAGLANFKECKGLTCLALGTTPVSDAGLANFKGMRLRELYIDNTGITDLTPLQGMPLEKILLTPKNITRGLDILRDMKSLKTIGIGWNRAWPAAEFWERYDRGEFK